MEQDITDIIERGEAEAVQDIIPPLTDDSLNEGFANGLENLSRTFVTTSQSIVSSAAGQNTCTSTSQLHVVSSTVQYSAVQYSTLYYNTVQCNAM